MKIQASLWVCSATRSSATIPFGLMCRWLAFMALVGAAPAALAAVVEDCSEAALRAAVAQGGHVRLACDGRIHLTAPLTVLSSTVIDATGRDVVLDGGGVSSIVQVPPGQALELRHLTLANGRAMIGGAIFGEDGDLRIVECQLTNNLASSPGNALGGAVYWAGGSLNIERSFFGANRAVSTAAGATGTNGVGTVGGDGDTGWSARGGAVWASGEVTISESYFSANITTGSPGGQGGQGGKQMTGCGPCPGFTGGKGGRGGEGTGGAVQFDSGVLRLFASAFASNAVAGGVGGTGGVGGDGDFFSSSTDGPGGIGGMGGPAKDGGLHVSSGSVLATNNTWFANQSTSGNGGIGGQNLGECLAGGQGGNGGDAFGGGVFDAGGETHLVNCTLAGNLVRSGEGASGGLGGTCAPFGARQTGPFGLPGLPVGAGLASGSASPHLAASVFSLNGSGGNCHGRLIDEGFNISSDISVLFTNLGGINNADVRLGSFANHGGPTPTMVLLSDSPAVDHCDGFGLAVIDQRGVSRTNGLAKDAGAFELEQSGSFPRCDGLALTAAAEVGGSVPIECDGVYLFSRPARIRGVTTIDASGRRVVLSGGRGNRLFEVDAGGELHLIGVTIRDGFSTNGGAILNDGGIVRLTGCVFATNRVTGVPGGNGGSVGLFQTGITGTNGVDACGGAILNLGFLAVSNTSFLGNTARGGNGGAGGKGGNSVGSADGFGRCRSQGSGAGGLAGNGGKGCGGAAFNLGVAQIHNSTFAGNVATGGNGGNGGDVGIIPCLPVSPGGPAGNGGEGGAATGAAIENVGQLTLIASTLYAGESIGGIGGTGGIGNQSSLQSDGTPGLGGRASGGGLFNSGTNAMVNTTIAWNKTTTARCGEGSGGGIANAGRLRMTNVTVWQNQSGVLPSANLPCASAQVPGSAIATSTNRSTLLVNSIIGTPGSSNCVAGPLLDGGFNAASDISPGLSAPGSLMNVNPQLGALADNGGASWTMSLLPGSPCLDAAAGSRSPSVDQRGRLRPVGGGFDMGACEGRDGLAYPMASQRFGSTTLTGAITASLSVSVSNVGPSWLTNLTLTIAPTNGLTVVSPPASACALGNVSVTDSGVQILEGLALAPQSGCVVVGSIRAEAGCGPFVGPWAFLTSPDFYPPLAIPPATALLQRPDNSPQSLRFDGVDDRVTSDAVEDLAAIYRFTLSLWIKTTSTRGGGIIGRLDTNSGQADQLIFMTDSGQIGAGVGRIWPFGEEIIYSPRSYNDGQWHCVVANFSQPGLKLYVDGALAAFDPAIRVRRSVEGRWTVGFLPLGGHDVRPASVYFAGQVDEVQVWPTDRSAVQVAVEQAQVLCGNEERLSYYWRLDGGGSGSVANSAAVVGNGILEGAPEWVADGAPIQALNPLRTSIGAIRLQQWLSPASVAVVESTADLWTWQPLGSLTSAPDGLATYIEHNVTAPCRFYRFQPRPVE